MHEQGAHEQGGPVQAHGQPVARQPPLQDDKRAARMANFIFVGTYGKIRALEIYEGAVRDIWTEKLKGCGHSMVHLKLFTPRGQLYCATNGSVFCIDALTGKIIWRAKPSLQHGMLASVLVTLVLSVDGSILVSGSNGTLVAFNAQSGQIVWQVEGSKPIFKTKSYFDQSAMVEHKGLLYVGLEDFVYAYHMSNGQLKWKVGLTTYGYGPISLAAFAFAPPEGGLHDILFVGTFGYVIALDGQLGGIRHNIQLDAPCINPVALLLDPPTNTLYVATWGQLRSFKADSMIQIWKSSLPGMEPESGHSLLIGDEATVIIGMSGSVAALDKASGRMEWRVSLPGCISKTLVTVAATANPNMLVCGTVGRLYGIDKRGRVLWQDKLARLWYHHMSISTTVFDTDFNSTTIPQSLAMMTRQMSESKPSVRTS